MKHIYLFDESSRASIYGIGTYIKQTALCIKQFDDIVLNIIKLRSDIPEITITFNENIRYINIPDDHIEYPLRFKARYYRNVWYLLLPYIKIDQGDKIIFHLNLYQQEPIIDLFKSQYPNGKICFTVHYLDWCFITNGNLTQFKHVIQKEKSDLKNELEKNIVRIYELEKILFKKVDKIICLSEYTKNQLINEYHIKKPSITTIYNGLEDEARAISIEEKTSIKKKLHINLNETIILFVGRLDKIKGISILLKSFQILIESYPDFRLILIGDGDFSMYLNESKGIWSNITWTGRLSKDELYEFYKIADLGIMPSMHEQCSYVAIEMMMHSLPTITTTTTGLNEMFDNNEYKLPILEEEDQVLLSDVQLAKLIVQALQPSNNKVLGQCNRHRYEILYKDYIVKEKMNKFYSTI